MTRPTRSRSRADRYQHIGRIYRAMIRNGCMCRNAECPAGPRHLRSHAEEQQTARCKFVFFRQKIVHVSSEEPPEEFSMIILINSFVLMVGIWQAVRPSGIQLSRRRRSRRRPGPLHHELRYPTAPTATAISSSFLL